MAGLVPYVILALIAFILLHFVSELFNFVWTLLMSSYSLSLPALLWPNSGAWNFPTFIPTGPKSPMAFYYWFFVIAAIVFIVAIAISSFRKLTFWGNFDQEVQAEETNGFAAKFKWAAALAFMTVLTPILIWIIYSLLMIGVYFFMTLIGKNAMFLSISKDDYNFLLKEVKNDLDLIINSGTAEGTLIYDVLKSLVDKKDVILQKLIAAGENETTARQYIYDLQNLLKYCSDGSGGLNDLRTMCSNFLMKLKGASFDSPISSSIISDFQTDLLAALNNFKTSTIIDPTTHEVVVKSQFIGTWRNVFGPMDGNIYSIKSIVGLAGLTDTEATKANQLIKQWEQGSGIFKAFGYTLSAQEQAILKANPNWTNSLERLAGQMSYINDSSKLGLFYLSFKSGSQVGLKTCPLMLYIDDIVGASPGAFIAMMHGKVNGLIGCLVTFLAGNELLAQASEDWVGPACAVLGGAMVAGAITAALWLVISMAVTMTIYFVCIRVMIKPLFGMTGFLWQAFFESLWYFFLLLPAIGASVADSNNKIYSTAWRHCIGKMSAILLLWAGLLMMFAALFQVDTVFDMIWNQGVSKMAEGWSGHLIIDIKIDMGKMSALQGLSLFFQLNFKAVLKFALATIVLMATFNLIQKLGGFCFGQDVYSTMAQMLQNPINGLLPGFSESMKSVKGMAGKVGNSKLVKGATNLAQNAMSRAQNAKEGERLNKEKGSLLKAMKSMPKDSEEYKNASRRLEAFDNAIIANQSQGRALEAQSLSGRFASFKEAAASSTIGFLTTHAVDSAITKHAQGMNSEYAVNKIMSTVDTSNMNNFTKFDLQQNLNIINTGNYDSSSADVANAKTMLKDLINNVKSHSKA